MAADSPGQKASCQASVKWQQMLQTTLKSAFLQDDQEIQNLTFLVGFFFLMLLVSFPLKIPSGRKLISEINTQV